MSALGRSRALSPEPFKGEGTPVTCARTKAMRLLGAAAGVSARAAAWAAPGAAAGAAARVAGVLAVGAALAVATSPGALAQTLTLLNPKTPSSSTTREFVNVLGRTEPGNRVSIAGQEVPVYSTGVFVRDRVPLTPGQNPLLLEVRNSQGGSMQLLLQVQREEPPPPAPVTDRLHIEAGSTQPRELRLISESETVDLGFSGTPGMLAEARWMGDALNPWFPLIERRPGVYGGRLLLRSDFDMPEAPVEFRLSALPGTALVGKPPVLAQSAAAIGLWRSEGLRLFSTGANNSDSTDLLFGLHEVRLGGPFLTELPAGVLLQVTGRLGDHYRVQLAPDLLAWAPVRSLAAAPAAAQLPQASFSSLTVSGNERGDAVDVAWPATLPYAARAVTGPDGQQHLELDLYGTHNAATWVTHKHTSRLVREASVEQQQNGSVRLLVRLKDKKLWGWAVERRGGILRLQLFQRPKVQAAAGTSPLQGWLIALEPGHGSANNLGAVGATGVPEKDINRWTTEALKTELERVGARVVVVREGDDNPPLRERAKRVAESGAVLFVSIHANAAETANGYLRAAGTGTFYKHTTARDLAAAIHGRMLQTGLADLGLIGAFNYTPIRLVTQMPAVLVEQAFVSHPEEEAKLLDPAFRSRMARAIREGIEDFVRP